MRAMRKWVAAAAAALGCTSVHVVQRDGCWLKRTEGFLQGTSEELGFCSKGAPQWSEDRLARLVQECMTQADYRWENRALQAWSRGQPIPPQESDQEISKICMSEASAMMSMEAENKALKARLGELSQERDSARMLTEKDREFLQQNSEKMVTALGEAAKKPAPTATATATSTGTAKTESDQRSAMPIPAAAPAAPAMTVLEVPAALPAAPAPQVRSKVEACPAGKVRKSSGKDAPICEKPSDSTALRLPGAG